MEKKKIHDKVKKAIENRSAKSTTILHPKCPLMCWDVIKMFLCEKTKKK
ncbi:MAG: hypothetical protein NZ521_05710 [Flammeovirgaceae bacterium]|nr:hypothetical protein [Flammeovirgaceae bacterium]MDW8287730.1 hypothetical protein [Flammeovirgaceae bacterium]